MTVNQQQRNWTVLKGLIPLFVVCLIVGLALFHDAKRGEEERLRSARLQSQRREAEARESQYLANLHKRTENIRQEPPRGSASLSVPTTLLALRSLLDKDSSWDMRISNNKCDHSYETFEARPHGYPEVLGVSAQVYCRAGSQSEGGDPIAAIQILAPIFGGSLLGIRVGMAREEALAVLRRNHADVHPEVRGGLPGETFLTADIPKGHPTKSEMTLYFSETGQVVSAELQDKRFAHMYFPSTTP